MENKHIRKLYRFRTARLPAEQQTLKTIMTEVSKRITIIGKRHKRAVLDDYKAAVLYYMKNDYRIEYIEKALDPNKLGTFYKKREDRWFPLDYAARVHSLTMSKNWMSVFRLSFTLKDEVIPELLQMAMTFTIKRFPLFATTVKRGVFWHYVDSSQQHYEVKPERNIPCSPMKVSRSNCPSMRIIYYKNRISLECFHILTDGLGAMVFLKTIVAEYLNLLGMSIPNEHGILDIGSLPDESELEDGYANVGKSPEKGKEEKLLIKKELGLLKPALTIQGRLSRVKPYRILHFEMDSGALKSLAERRGVKITTVVLGFIISACMMSSGDRKGTVKIQVPVNMRPYYGSGTLANFTQYCIIRIEKQDEPDFDALLRDIEEQLLRGTLPEVLGRTMLRSAQLVNMMRWVPLFIKRTVLRLGFHAVSGRVYTTSLSNLGLVRLPSGMSGKVEKIQCLLGAPAINRESCALTTYGQISTLSVTKVVRKPDFEENLASVITEHGLTLKISGSEPYEG